MLRNHKPMCSGQLGDINESEMHIYIVPKQPFMSAPYSAGPKTR